MELSEKLFFSIPDTAFITDAYGFILDYNRPEPFEKVKKGVKLTKLIPDCFEGETGLFRAEKGVFRRQTSPIIRGGTAAGYTVLLSDITAEAELSEERRARAEELRKLAESLRESNRELESYALRVKELTDYAEQRRIAQVMHDDAGHAITELNAISQMCLALRESDPERCRELIREGIGICERAKKSREEREYGSLAELLEAFRHLVRLPCDIELDGEEPVFLRDKYSVIDGILREAYHNVLDHSLADRMTVSARLSPEKAELIITDNGSFHGKFEKGFGLSAMEERVAASGGSVSFLAETGRGFEIRVLWRN